MTNEKNKRIAKNTMLLYIRMLFTMAVSLYTSRVIMNTLGISDFGIYNIIGGVIILFSFLNNAMSSATQRFLNFEIGKNDLVQLKKIFSVSVNVHITIALIVVIFSETIGLWFVNTQLNLPVERINAANWVYQFTILTFIINIIQVPYNATIIAHERMSFYSYVSIIDVILRLLVVVLLQYLEYDKLKLYAILLSTVAFIIIITYKIYCNKKFESSRYILIWDLSIYKKLLNFSGWSLFGSIANIGKAEFINILLNIFYGVTVNAAIGITNQISGAINGFVSNFQIAFNPQIVKSYASNEKKYLMNLIFKTSKYSYFLLFFLSVPILLNTDYILKLWLNIVPKYTVEFCQLTIILLLVESISGPLWMAVQATGKIRNYQISISCILLMNIPISYSLIKFNFVPYSVLWVNIGIGILALMVRIFFLKKLINLKPNRFFKEVILVIISVTLVSFPIAELINSFLAINSFGEFTMITLISYLIVVFTIFYIGLSSNERDMILNKLKIHYNK